MPHTAPIRINTIGCSFLSFQMPSDSTRKIIIAGTLMTEPRLAIPDQFSVCSREAANTSSIAPKIRPADAGRRP